MQIAQQMHPAALVLARVDVVARVEVTDQMAPKRAAQQAFRHSPRPRRVIFVVPDRLLTWRAKRPDIPTLARFPPTGLIRMQDRTGSRLDFEPVQFRLRGAPHMMEQLTNLADADAQLVEGLQVGLNAAERQAQGMTQEGDQAGGALRGRHWSSTCPRKSSFGACQRLHQAHQRLITWCSITSTGCGSGISITWRRRARVPPGRRWPQSGQRSKACCSMRVGGSKRRA